MLWVAWVNVRTSGPKIPGPSSFLQIELIDNTSYFL
jgi:hypothetical protein